MIWGIKFEGAWKILLGGWVACLLLVGPAALASADGGTWTTKAPLPVVSAGAVGHVVDGKFYVIRTVHPHVGESQAFYVYDPQNDRWTTRAPMPTARSTFAHGVINGIIYTVGGWNGWSSFSTVEAYNPATDSWATKAPKPGTGRREPAAGVVDGKLYVVGGFYYYADSVTNEVWAYDPLTNTWEQKASMPSERMGHAVGVVDGILYVIGGRDFTTLFNSVEAYNPATNTWTAKAPMPTPRASFAVEVMDGKLYAIGGSNLVIRLNTVEVYDPKTDTWTTETPMPTARQYSAIGAMNGALHVVGGSTSSGSVAVHEAFTPAALPVNHPPVVAPIGNKEVGEGETLQFAVSASDPDGDAMTYAVSNLPSDATFDPSTATFTWTPTFGRNGSYSNILFTVTDDGNQPQSASEAITITVGRTDRPPVFEPTGPQIGSEGELIQFAVSALDPDGDRITYLAGNLPAGATFDQSSGVFSWTPGFGQGGNYQVLFTAMDSWLPPLTDSLTVAITVNNVNRPPVMTLIGDKTASENETLSFVVTASDPDGDLLTYSAANLPPGATFDAATQTFAWTPAYDAAQTSSPPGAQPGQYLDVEFTVADNGAPVEIASQLIDISITNVNRPPVFAPIGTLQVLEGQKLNFFVQATDYDGNLITYSTGPLPANATFDPSTLLFFWRPDYTQAGIHTVVFYGQDDDSNSMTGQLEVVISVGEVTATDLTNQIIKAVADLELPTEILNSYTANLKKVNIFMEANKVTPAINQLGAFVKKVQEDMSKGKIGDDDGNSLIDMAQDVLWMLGN